MKEQLCKAFCDELIFREVPIGLAVSTSFNLSNGEPLGFYVTGPDGADRYRIEDDGTTIPFIEASGANLDSQTRAEAFDELLKEYNAKYDVEAGELKTAPLSAPDIPHAALKFVALLLRLQDMVLLTPERAASTFKEDATRAIRESFGERATIEENVQIAHGIEFPADIIVRAENRTPVAIYLALSEQRVLEAVVAQMAVLYEADIACAVVALLERPTSITHSLLRQAANRLSAMPVYEGDEKAAIQRIEREIFGTLPRVH